MKKFCVTLFVLFLIVFPLSAQSRGGGHDEEGPRETAGGISISGKQWAVFIAIDNYREKAPLLYPVKDAKEIKNILLENYYIDEIVELYNRDATNINIRQLFVDLQNKTGPNDSVFIFHAGHGYNDDRTKTSAWIPYDGGENTLAQVNWLDHALIRRMLNEIRAKHVFLISDSCYSGDLLVANRAGTSPAVIDYPAAYDKRSQQAMSSGVSEEVPDKSEFAARLKDVLLRTETPYITPDSLWTKIKEAETSIPLIHIPQFGNIPGNRYELGGSFLFFRKNPRQVAAAQPSASRGSSTRADTPSASTQTTAAAYPSNMVRIEGGAFTMGSPANEVSRDSDEVQHRVTVSTFYMSKYQVTQAEYQVVMRTNPSYFKGANLPVENVSWYDAVEYCNALSQREGLTPAYTIDKSRSDPNNKNEYDNLKWLVTRNPNANGYRLPTEAEWEYACRAGTTTPFSTGNNITTSQANYDGNYPYNNNAKGTYREKTTPVGSFAANRWGLYDMHGNVWEWCWDWYGEYKNEAQTNPTGAVSGASRVIRGGGWNSNAGGSVRSASRSDGYPSGRYANIGFRLVRP